MLVRYLYDLNNALVRLGFIITPTVIVIAIFILLIIAIFSCCIVFHLFASIASVCLLIAFPAYMGCVP